MVTMNDGVDPWPFPAIFYSYEAQSWINESMLNQQTAQLMIFTKACFMCQDISALLTFYCSNLFGILISIFFFSRCLWYLV